MRLRTGQRLFLSYLLLISLVVLLLSIAVDVVLRTELTNAEADNLRRELALGTAMYEGTAGLAPDSAARLLGALSGRRVTIVARDGEVLGESTPGRAPAEMDNHLDRPEVQAALAGEPIVAVRGSRTIGTEHLYIATMTERGDVLRFALPLAELNERLAGLQRTILGAGGLALLVAVLFSIGFSIAGTRPLRRMQAVAAALASGDLTPRLRERRTDELGDLARALDTLADELQKRLGQLENERAEMQTLIDSMEEGVLAVGPTGTLRRANPAARRMFSLPDSPVGIPPEAVTRRPEFLRLVRAALAGETAPAVELTGERRSLLATAHPLPGGGAVLVILDVSELRRLEGVRRDFVANASHELKTPLTAIRGYAETLVDPELTPDLRARFAEVVKQHAERLQHLVDDLLDLSRIESGGWMAQPEAVEIEAVAREAWASTGELGEGLAFDLEIEPAAAIAHADPAALHQIFGNLFSNAVRHTPAGGSVTVTARRGAGADGEVIIVEVRDTGSGIPAASLPRIFERFYRADPARSREAGGTGLGLSIVKHLVEAHGGQASAESELGRGTLIRFTLPAAGDRERRPSPRRAARGEREEAE